MRPFPLLPLLLSLAACTGPATQATAPEAPAGGSNPPAVAPAASPASPSADATPPSAQFAPRLLEIAREYTAWGRVDDELRWAPYLCRAPFPARLYVSASEDDASHGQKLYSLFAKDRDAYKRRTSTPGQVLVKEAWRPERVADGAAAPYPLGRARSSPPGNGGDEFVPYAKSTEGEVFRAAQRAGLFIMYKLDPSTPETDGGWVYGTLTPAGEVTSAGRVASCMGCHEKAPHDRLFGVPTGG